VPLPENSPKSQKAKLDIANGASISTRAKEKNAPNRTAYRWASDQRVRARAEKTCRRALVDRLPGQWPSVRRGTSSRSDLPELWRPRTLANRAADTPYAGRFPLIRRVPRGDQFGRLAGRWHRNPLLARAAERFGTAISRAENGPESTGMSRHTFFAARSLRSDNLGASNTLQEPCFGSIPNMEKWHKRPQKAATLCHFLALACKDATGNKLTVAHHVPLSRKSAPSGAGGEIQNARTIVGKPHAPVIPHNVSLGKTQIAGRIWTPMKRGSYKISWKTRMHGRAGTLRRTDRFIKDKQAHRSRCRGRCTHEETS
jgi:hypothetical protein